MNAWIETPYKAFPNEFESAGMDLRDYFAAAALQGLISGREGGGMNRQNAAEVAYEFADAMMKARMK